MDGGSKLMQPLTFVADGCKIRSENVIVSATCSPLRFHNINNFSQSIKHCKMKRVCNSHYTSVFTRVFYVFYPNGKLGATLSPFPLSHNIWLEKSGAKSHRSVRALLSDLRKYISKTTILGELNNLHKRLENTTLY